MNFNDPSLYSVTPREMTPFVGGYPFAWQNVPRFLPPFQTYGPFQPYAAYGVQPPFHGMGGIGQLTPPFPGYGQQPLVPPAFAYGTPYATPPWMTPQGVCSLPFAPPIQGWQRPFWY